MGCCASRQRPGPQLTTAEICHIRKSQISPPIIFGRSTTPESPTSEYSNTSRYDPPTPQSPTKTLSKNSLPRMSHPPTCNIQPPAPHKALEDVIRDLEVEQRKEELAADINEVGTLLGKLVHAIRAYSFSNKQVQTQTLSDFTNILTAMPKYPRGLLVRQQIQTLEMDVANLYTSKRKMFRKHCEPALTELEDIWADFVALDDEQRRTMAEILKKGCLLIQIFDYLSLLRAGCEDLLTLDLKVSKRIAQDFDVILARLREGDCVKRGDDGVFRGAGDSVTDGASMQWRVLEIVEGKRRDGLRGKMDAVKQNRAAVSVALLGVVEALAEDA